MKIMIVESDTEFREHLVQRLASEGLSSLDSGNLDEAEQLVKKHKVQAIVLGLSGFGRSSLSFMKNISTIVPDLKVILINRHNKIPLSIEAMNLGACAEIPVPVDIAVLVKTLQSATAENQQQKDG
ncbi:Response regulator receiver domain-containing protein [Maridesulfovibrio ferrireducens]|uniref:Response regulator receiver domain-containing protein n=1 Tax=Maridesulfovibrio ferrireducens TaxID=246191 RepID=A0A1G9CXG5_9BACT|nr:response regulator [Maridesulfovibrio ferrireducens]SDK56361.1 Response regulator receiver domain-containing protein [Maridesulfovibrio ferrireducens]